MESTHTPVLPEEILAFVPASPRIIVDGTLGEAGHSKLFHAKYPEARIIGLDRDPEMLDRLRPTLGGATWIELHRKPYRLTPEVLAGRHADFILLDLGVSMFHFKGAKRGFSYQDELLDMRLDPDLPLTAADLLNRKTERELKLIFQEYGEERFAGRIARTIFEKRPVHSAQQLAALILAAVPGKGKSGIHPATRVFQALRIVVNRELEEIEGSIPHLAEVLAPNGRLAIISFHSLEDRCVKHGFRALGRERFKILTPKPTMAGEAEVSGNPASRSAKLRVIEKLADSDR
ncbi:MAG: 16S rRNA (cytosine(1402)-N(4))-methyltransferase RsmH [Spirochaetia bacterium]|nr:16S rRNA (cytosine(1402)-N(4))-methyltransferase RsmH [Spirochaetia bacterium]